MRSRNQPKKRKKPEKGKAREVRENQKRGDVLAGAEASVPKEGAVNWVVHMLLNKSH